MLFFKKYIYKLTTSFLSFSFDSPLEIQMRKHELQAQLRDLKTKNSTLQSLISQLGMEWKEVSIYLFLPLYCQ